LGGVLINGTSAIHLSLGLPADGDVTSIKVMPNGLGVVFIADYAYELFNLWINAMIGSEPFPVDLVLEGSSSEL
jgi:hypothetical protein